MDKPIRVFIVEDHAIFLAGLKRVIAELEGIMVAGEATSGQEFLDIVPDVEADLVLMDIRLPGIDGIKATELALKVRPDLRILAFSMFGEADYIYSMILLGVSGFVLKSSSLEILEKAIRTVAAGGQFFSAELNVILANRLKQMNSTDLPSFTKRETLILKHLCRGLSTQEIAVELSVSKRTVEGYRAKMLHKAEVTNTTNLVVFAIRNNLVKIDELGPERS